MAVTGGGMQWGQPREAGPPSQFTEPCSLLQPGSKHEPKALVRPCLCHSCFDQPHVLAPVKVPADLDGRLELADLNMLVMTEGGRERTPGEYALLLEAVSVVEAVAS